MYHEVKIGEKLTNLSRFKAQNSFARLFATWPKIFYKKYVFYCGGLTYLSNSKVEQIPYQNYLSKNLKIGNSAVLQT